MGSALNASTCSGVGRASRSMLARRPRWLPVSRALWRMCSGSWSKPIPLLRLGLGTSNRLSWVTRLYQSPPRRAMAWNLCGSMPAPESSRISSRKWACTARQITRLPPPLLVPTAIICSTTHSNDTGHSSTRGGRTSSDLASVRPALLNSLTPRSYSVLASDICSTTGKSQILMTHSATSRTFSRVCFWVLSRTRLAGEKTNVGGLELNTLKKLNGLRLTSPAAEMVRTKAMGRGATAPSINWCHSAGLRVPGVMVRKEAGEGIGWAGLGPKATGVLAADLSGPSYPNVAHFHHYHFLVAGRLE